MKPSVGRIVHYIQGGEHFAAIVTTINSQSPTSVNLCVFPCDRGPENHYSVSQGGNVEEGTWHWPEREE